MLNIWGVSCTAKGTHPYNFSTLLFEKTFLCDNLWGCELESGLSVRVGARRDSGRPNREVRTRFEPKAFLAALCARPRRSVGRRCRPKMLRAAHGRPVGGGRPVNGEPAILRFAISEEEHERALTLVSATSRRAPPVESDEDEDEDEEAGGAPAAATALGPPPRRLTLRHGRKVPAVKYF